MIKKKREIVAVLLLPLIYLYIMELPAVFFFGLLLIISGAAQMEFYSMFRVKTSFSLLGVVAGLLLLYLVYTGEGEFHLFLVFLFMLVMLFRLSDSGRGPEHALADVAPVLVGVMYVPLILSLQLHLRAAGPEWVIFTCATVWASDASAYYVGKNFGRRKLYPSMSPKKTVEGAVGSMIGGAAAATAIRFLLMGELTLYQVLAAGFLVGSFSVLGDLTESMFKRDSGVKDSSALIPGHGGVLDKIDGMLFATPVVYMVVRLVAS